MSPASSSLLLYSNVSPTVHLPRTVLLCMRGQLPPGCFCNSWRHEGRCADVYVDRVLRRFHPSGPGWTATVLTFQTDDPADIHDLYRRLPSSAAQFQRRLRKKYGFIHLFRAVEETETGIPHLNFLFWSPDLEEACIAGSAEPLIQSIAQGCGFGEKATIKLSDDPRGFASYMLKQSQRPIHAPRHFRRWMASRGLLAPGRKKKAQG